MKKLLLFIIIVLVIGTIAWRMGTFTTPGSPARAQTTDEIPRSPDEIVATDFQKIEKNLKRENIQADEWKDINTYTLKVEDMVNSGNAQYYFQVAQKNLPDIYSCLKRDFCGMEPAEGDPYFDDQRTPAHILMNRSLKVIRESLRENPDLSSQVDWDLMEELAQSDADMLKVEALDIIREHSRINAATEDILKTTKNYTGEAKADALLRVSNNAGPKDKQLLAGEIADVFEIADPHTVISVLENMDKMKLSKESMLNVFSNLCRFKQNELNPGNWKMIESLASKLNPEFKTLCQ